MSWSYKVNATALSYTWLCPTQQLYYYNDTSSVRLRVRAVLNVCFPCCSNQARPPCVLQKSHSDRREVENKLPQNEWSLEHCGGDVGTTFSRATVYAGAYATPRAERGRRSRFGGQWWEEMLHACLSCHHPHARRTFSHKLSGRCLFCSL